MAAEAGAVWAGGQVWRVIAKGIDAAFGRGDAFGRDAAFRREGGFGKDSALVGRMDAAFVGKMDAAIERTAMRDVGSDGAWLADGFLNGRDSATDCVPRGVTVLSVCNPEEGFSTAAAMERNALIYAAASRSLVVESRFREGGTWHGATSAMRRRLTAMYHRDVACGLDAGGDFCSDAFGRRDALGGVSSEGGCDGASLAKCSSAGAFAGSSTPWAKAFKALGSCPVGFPEEVFEHWAAHEPARLEAASSSFAWGY
jgi:hypothetical protein